MQERWGWAGARRAGRLLAAPLAVVAAGSLATALLAGSASAASAPGPLPGMTPGADSYPSAEKWCACTINLFYTGTNGSVVSQDVTPGTPVNGPNDLGGHLISGPAPVYIP